MASRSSNKTAVPEAKGAMNKFKCAATRMTRRTTMAATSAARHSPAPVPAASTWAM